MQDMAESAFVFNQMVTPTLVRDIVHLRINPFIHPEIKDKWDNWHISVFSSDGTFILNNQSPSIEQFLKYDYSVFPNCDIVTIKFCRKKPDKIEPPKDPESRLTALESEISEIKKLLEKIVI